MGFKVYKNNALPVVLNDLGVTLTGAAGTIVDLTHLEPSDVARSIDLRNAVNSGDILVTDARDDFNAQNVIITNTANGNVADATAGTSGFTVTKIQEGDGSNPEISQVAPTLASALSGGEYFTFSDGTPTAYYVWFTVDGAGADPTPGGTAIPVSLSTADTQDDVAYKIKQAIATAGAGATTNVQNLFSAAESLEAIDNHNDTHFGISGGRFGLLDEPNSMFADGNIVRYDLATDTFIACSPSTFGPNVGSQGVDGTDTTFQSNLGATVLFSAQDETLYDATNNNGTFVGGTGGTYAVNDVITLSDGSEVTVDAVSGGVVTQFTVTESGETSITAGVPLTQTGVVPAGGTGFSLTPQDNNISSGTIQWNVDDVFLRNTGDTLDSGTLTIASGAAVTFNSTSSLTFNSGANPTASLTTPTNGFQNNTDLINKGYVDAVAQGIDWKESVRRSTTATEGDLGGTYVDQDAGGPDGVGDTITFDSVADLTAAQDETNYDGVGGNGIFFGGAGGYANLDTITLSDGSVITVDLAVAGVVTQFTVTTSGGTNVAPGATLTQTGTSGVGTGFTLQPQIPNLAGTQLDGWSYTGNPATGLDVGDRVLVKDQTNAYENGIYVVTAGSTPTATILTRATDQDGSPGFEVSGGNTTYIETGPTCAQCIWSLIWDGQIDFSVPDPLNWSQTGAATGVVANEGLNAVSNKFNLDISTLTQTASITPSDVLAFQDVAGSAGTDTTTTKVTAANFITDLDIISIAATGIIVNTGGGPTTVSIAVNGAGDRDGLSVTNADGTAGNPTLGLDIENLPYVTSGGGSIDAANDQVAVWDMNLDRNVYYTINDIAGAAIPSDSYTNWSRTGNGSGGPIGPATATDQIQWTGGDGINIQMSSGTPDNITLTFSRDGMADTAIVKTDTFPFFDDTAANPEYRSFEDALSDLNVPFDIAGLGIVRKTSEGSPDTYETIGIIASTNEDLDGLDVQNGALGDTGNVEVGLDIVGLNDPDDDMATTDEFAVHDKSEGTGGANQKITGQNIADGVANILNISGLTFATFPAANSPAEDQTLLAYTDSTRSGSPQLSVESHTFVWAEDKLNDNDWLDIGDAVDSDSGFIMPFDGRIVMASGHCENLPAGTTFDIEVYVGVPTASPGTNAGAVVTLPGAANTSDSDPTLDISFNAGDKIKLRANRTAGGANLEDTVVSLMVKWEA